MYLAMRLQVLNDPQAAHTQHFQTEFILSPLKPAPLNNLLICVTYSSPKQGSW